MNESPFIERRLSQLEIHERRLNVESLLDEKDRLTDAIEERKRDIKDDKVEIDRIEFRVREVRKEIRQGFVLEPRQVGMSFSVLPRNDGPTLADREGNPVEDPREHQGIDGSTDDPAPEIDPTAPDAYLQRYPVATDHGKLRGDLAVVLGNRGLRVPSLDELRQWHERTGVFDAMAHWARVEIAWMNHKEHPELALPARKDMPEKLADLIAEKPKTKRKRATQEGP